MQILQSINTKDICFDESEEFTHVRKEGNFNHTTSARNVVIFGVDMKFSKHEKCFIETLRTQVINFY